MTVVELLRRATEYLDRHGSASPRLDAELLLANSLGLRRLDLYLQHDRQLDERELVPYRESIRLRGEGQPVAYLTGHKEFMGLDFEVTPAVLVPNPDTELLVQLAITFGRERDEPLVYADVGTGSGCIAVSIAHYLVTARVVAVDTEEAALDVARRNAARLGVAERVRFARGNLLEPLAGTFDAICANLPYISSELRLDMEVEVQPAVALFAGPRGGELIERLLESAPAHLNPGAIVLAEIDPVIVTDVLDVAKRTFATTRVHRDLGGHERVLEARDPK